MVLAQKLNRAGRYVQLAYAPHPSLFYPLVLCQSETAGAWSLHSSAPSLDMPPCSQPPSSDPVIPKIPAHSAGAQSGALNSPLLCQSAPL